MQNGHVGGFFLNHWRSHIQTCAQDYPEFISIKKNFIAPVTFNILMSLSKSMILLIIAYQDFYPYPFTPWMYGSEGLHACIRPSSGSLRTEKEKTTSTGYISYYSDSSITKNLEILRDWPSDDDIKGAINHAYEQATALAKDVLGIVLNTKICSSQESSSLQANNIFISAAAMEVNTWDRLNVLNE
ncbi:7230_t:CDS:2, partial [Gigaspora rosea]